MPVWGWIVLWVSIGILAFALISYIVMQFIIGLYVYRKQTVRVNKDAWGRHCSAPGNIEQEQMWDIGMQWAKPYQDKKIEVEIENDGLKLVGEYFDFGYDKAVIFLAGRSECLFYSYYYAKPYQEAGYNTLFVDQRAHGESDGDKNYIGIKEKSDALKWAELLHDKFNVKHIVFHGVCIGSACSLYALTDPNCPDYIEAMIADGMYATFYDTFKNHMIYQKRPMWPALPIIMGYFRVLHKIDPVKSGPIYYMPKLTKPIMFIYSELDAFSTKDQQDALYKACNSDKTLALFPKGAHSHVRINQTEEYDAAVKKFLNHLNK